MMTIRRCLMTGVAFATLLPLSQAVAQRGAPTPPLLSGIREVQMGVTADDVCTRFGLDTSMARVDGELAVRRMGIQVVQKAAVVLHVGVNCTPVTQTLSGAKDTAVMIVHIGGRVREWATSLRFAGKAPYLVTSWELEWFGYVPTGQPFSPPVIAGMSELLSRFENDWLAANPPKRP